MYTLYCHFVIAFLGHKCTHCTILLSLRHRHLWPQMYTQYCHFVIAFFGHKCTQCTILLPRRHRLPRPQMLTMYYAAAVILLSPSYTTNATSFSLSLATNVHNVLYRCHFAIAVLANPLTQMTQCTIYCCHLFLTSQDLIFDSLTPLEVLRSTKHLHYFRHKRSTHSRKSCCHFFTHFLPLT